MLDILLSTYNGEKYLAQQLDSLFAQTFINFQIYIRDDGSTDNTLGIIHYYSKKKPQIIQIINDNLGNIGAFKSFMRLLHVSQSHYIMFCDQDDVWFPKKVEKAIFKMKEIESKLENKKPILIFSDLTVVDENLSIINRSFWKYQKIDCNISLNWKNLLAQNVVTGCTIIINRAVKNIVFPYPQTNILHDQWISVNVSKKGYIFWINEPTIYYRQHNKNTEGAKRFSLKYSFRKIKKIYKIIKFYKIMSLFFKNEISATNIFARKIIINIQRLMM